MLNYQIVEYKGLKYAVCCKTRNDEPKLFVIDAKYVDAVNNKNKSWYFVNVYIGYITKDTDTDIKYITYLHDFIMDVTTDNDEENIVNHINQIPTDNRKVNLQIVDKSIQHSKKGSHKRTVILPKKSGIQPDEIPKCVYYVPPKGKHGDKFTINIMHNGERHEWHTSTSVKYSLKYKLIEAKVMLLDIEKKHPEIVENKNIICNYTRRQIKLMKEYNEIIKLSDYDCVDDNLVKIPIRTSITVDYDEIDDEFKRYLDAIDVDDKSGKTHGKILPKECGITRLPKYCSYREATEKRGDMFIISKHPNLPKGKRQRQTSESKKVSTKDKLDQMFRILDELNMKAKAATKSGSKTAVKSGIESSKDISTKTKSSSRIKPKSKFKSAFTLDDKRCDSDCDDDSDNDIENVPTSKKTNNTKYVSKSNKNT